LLCLGGQGIISVVSNVVPADTAAMIDAFIEGNITRAKELHFRMTPLVDALFIESNPIPVKTALAMMGMIDGELRLPLYNMAETNKVKLRQAMVNYGLIK